MELILADSAWDRDPHSCVFYTVVTFMQQQYGEKQTFKHAFLRKKLSVWIIASNNRGFSVTLWVMWDTAFKLCLCLNASSDVSR